MSKLLANTSRRALCIQPNDLAFLTGYCKIGFTVGLKPYMLFYDMSYLSYLSFIPIYKERVWGGRNFQYHLGRSLPSQQKLGESWDVVDREDSQSIVKSGLYQGLSLRKLIELHAEDIIGPHWPTNKRFPLLVKWLDCQERLSLQVHPPKALAQELGGEPKCENWYIAECLQNASLFAGLKKGIDKKSFEKALEDHKVEEYLHTICVKRGDSFFVPSGRLHAIDAGNLILEIQENSDTTYRVYDWGRLDLDGKPRALHREQSLRSIQFKDCEPKPIPYSPGYQLLAQCPAFRIRKYDLNPDSLPLKTSIGEGAILLSIIRGQLQLIGTDQQDPRDLCTGQTILLPYSQHFAFKALVPTTVLLTDQFTS